MEGPDSSYSCLEIHMLEGGERGENGAADPDGVLALGRRDDLDLHRGRRESGDLLRHAVSDASIHGGAARQHDVGVEVLTDVNVALHNRIVGGLVHARRLHAEEGRLEERLRAAEALVANGDDLAVRKLIALLDSGGLRGGGHFRVEVKGNVGELLLDITHNLALGGGGEGVATLSEELDHPVSEVTASEVEAEDGVRQRVALVDRDGVRHAISRPM